MMKLIVFLFSIVPNIAQNIEPPNIVLLLLDDIGWGDVSYNCDNSTGRCPLTPHLDDLAHGDNSLLFHRHAPSISISTVFFLILSLCRFYAGSAVCSPTRSAALTGRSPDRDCVWSAQGCGQQPAWECVEHMPLPLETFTIAEAVKKKSELNYSTIHLGKWHLGDFFPKKGGSKMWPVSHPGLHGFDQWFSTEASAASSTTNCGCFHPRQGQCIIGGGYWADDSLECTNYWFPAPEVPLNVSNSTEKVSGDDSEWMVDRFEDFLRSKPERFLAAIWIHTVHIPHCALPEYYHKYSGCKWKEFPRDDCDYRGSITQMDEQVGRIRMLLRSYGVAKNTMLWMTSDNGPAGRPFSTNGLRQCKGSCFEGGIREPGVLEWPAMIKSHRETWIPAYVGDYLPTVMDVLNVTSDTPNWAIDGISLMPLIQDKDKWISRPRPFGFSYQGQTVWLDNEMKLVQAASNGQCPWQPPWDQNKAKNALLFNLTADPNESVNLSNDLPDLYESMKQQMADFLSSLKDSQENESGCANDQ